MNAEPYRFSTRSSAAAAGLAVWEFSARRACTTRVIPDGCTDIIVRTSGTGEPDWFVSSLSESVYAVDAERGETSSGIRLRPGTRTDSMKLDSWLKSRSVTDLFENDRIDEFCCLDASLAESLACLASGMTSVASVARELAVSTRTLQRTISVGTGRSPHYWISLARIRRAAKGLSAFDRLSDAAAAFHFSDQAHMSREMQRWFGLSAAAVKADVYLQDQLGQPGYGQG